MSRGMFVRAAAALVLCLMLSFCKRGVTPAMTDTGGRDVDANVVDAAMASQDAGCSMGETGAPQLRRLSRAEYARTVEDLLGVPSVAAEQFAADTVVNGFDNNGEALTVTPLLADQIAAEAERLAGLAVQDLSALLSCDIGEGESCAKTFISDFGGRAFRRPVTTTEADRYLSLFTLGNQNGDFASGMELVLTAMLQSPNFLYRTEIGDGSDAAGEPIELTDYEVATELAYALTGSTPDKALLDAAQRGELKDEGARKTQAQRLLNTPHGKQRVADFVRQWLGLGALGSVPKDATLFPKFDSAVRAAMDDELSRFVEEVVFNSSAGDLKELLTAPYTLVDNTLANFYGLPGDSSSGTEFVRVESTSSQQAGVLTLGAVMAVHARPDSSSPIHRGKLVRERMLCQPLSLPPPGVVVSPPPVDPSLTVRERYAAHSQKEPCKSCHRLIDPIGLAFEHFDGVGRYRKKEGDLAIDATGEIVDSQSSDASFDGTVELAAVLAQSAEVRDCFALQWLQFSYGVDEQNAPACLADELQRRFAEAEGNILSLLVASTEPGHMVRRKPWMTPPSPVELAEPDAGLVSLVDASNPAEGGVAQEDVVVQTRTDSQWQTGRCDSVTVTNATNAELNWQVTIDVRGTLNDHWNTTVQGTMGEVVFTGVDWNSTLAPGASADFGYCVVL